MKRLIISVLVVSLIASASLGFGWIWVQSKLQKQGPLMEAIEIVIEPGSGLGRIARQLESASVIDSARLFRLHTQISGFSSQLKAGEYHFMAGISSDDVLTKLVSNDVLVRFITVPEGLTSSQLIELISAAEGLEGDITQPFQEGTLLPETYGFSRGETRDALIARMAEQMKLTVQDLWLSRADDLPLQTPLEAVILASIIEKETALPSERSRVAAVFINRLNRGMRLQSDPTVAFGASAQGYLGRPLRRSDLESETPFNTYKILGLPPGPICHPGRDALVAALNPASSDELYFVAEGSGGHVFAKTLAEHNRNVAKWRRIQKQQGSR